MRKVLIILYYWAPAGGSAVQRWLKFSKYLPEHGWQPVIYAPENAEYPDLDPDLASEVPDTVTVIRQPIAEPVHFYKKFVGGGKNSSVAASMSMKSELKGFSKFKHKIAWWIRSNLFIPDAHFLWIRPSVRFLRDYLTQNPVDVIITTGPPQSLHLIGHRLHRSMKIPWIADFRDPWTNIDFYASLNLTRWADKKHHKLESRVLKSASHIITIGQGMKEEFALKGAKNLTVITNGYDDDDFGLEEAIPDDKFSIVHLGTLSATRNSHAFWKALSSKIETDPDFKKDVEIKLIGARDYTVDETITNLKLREYVTGIDFVPHKTGIEILKRAQLLLLLINRSQNAKGIITGKFFEYLAVRRPILLIGPPDGDAAKILQETKGGAVAGFDDEEGIRDNLDHYYSLYRNGKLNFTDMNTSHYSRKHLTGILAAELDKLSGPAKLQ